MRKFFASAFVASVFSILLFSCSNNSDNVVSFDETETLQYEARRLENEIDWQNEIEGEILVREIKKKNGIDPSRVTLTHRAVLANEKSGDAEKIFPYLEGFGSLDLTDFSSEKDAERRKLIDDFCSALVSGKDCDSFFDKLSLFSLALFYDELKTVSGVNYFELNDALQETSEITEKTGEASEKPVIKKKSLKKIDSYILGKPFSDESCFFVPVRFKIGREKLDAEVFLEKFGETWKIDGIEIKKFG